MKPSPILLAVGVLTFGLGAALLQGAEPIDFSRDIRPILSNNCYLCHGPDDATREADLRLDQRDPAIEYGAIVPGDVSASQLIARITTTDSDLRMPPADSKKTLTPRQIELLQQWVRQGALYEAHWAFQRPTRPSVPSPKEEAEVPNPIDAFVQARLDQEGLKPAPPADRATLARRLSLDLVGLPPTPGQVDQFINDSRPEAYDELVDSLLASPHFGERWGRWWLDAARYADSDGYEKDKPREVWFYRDWVVRALNDDLPFDQFVIQQVAGDLLPGAGQDERVATGFLRNSMVNEEGGADPEQFRVEGMFDRVDAIGKAVLGLTTQCAQCHTHKYDPLSHREYYQMFAALNDFHEATITVFTPQQEAQRQEVMQKIAAVEKQIKQKVPNWKDRLDQWEKEITQRQMTWRTVQPTEVPFDGQKFRVLEDGSILGESYAPTRTSPTFRGEAPGGRLSSFRLEALTHPQLPRGGPGRSIYGTAALTEIKISVAPLAEPDKWQEVKLVKAYSDVNPSHTRLPEVYRDRDPEKDERVTGPVEYAIDGDGKTAWSTDIGTGRRNQDRYAIFVPEKPLEIEGDVRVSFTLQQNHGGWNSDDNQNYLLGRYRLSISSDDPALAPDQPSSDLRAIVDIPAADRNPQQRSQLLRAWAATVEELADEVAQIESLWQVFPETPSQLVVEALDQPRATYIFDRGDFLSPTEKVTPAAPEFLHPFPQTEEPDRLRFARWLVADEAPTTPRAVVNRIWQAYFGRGLVETPEDLGLQSGLPSHPRLLDWLAVELVESGWSLKHIHRLIVQSATYRQSSVTTPQLAEHDPYNVLLARGPRFRVPAEMVRDIALSASGLLNDQIGGPPVYPPAPEFLFLPPTSYGPKQWNLSTDGQQYRRSLYVHSYRSVPYPTLQVFDAPKGDASCVRRPQSNTPLQALVLLNEPQFVECAQAMAARVLNEIEATDKARLEYAFRLAVSRLPQSAELATLQQLLDQQRARIAAGEINAEALIADAPVDTQAAPHEHAAWMVVCRALLNLDETISKP